MKTGLYLLLVIILSSSYQCTNKNDSVKFNEKLKRSLLDYKNSGNIDYLNKAYIVLNENKDFKREGLSKENYKVVIPVLFELKKYDELEELLEKFEEMNSYEKMNYLNIIKGLNINKYDSIQLKSFFNKNINIIKDSINKTPKDSILYLDYFANKMLLNGKNKTIIEIDSMQDYNKNFSNLFYEKMLKQMIVEYPTDRLPKYLNDTISIE